MQRQHPETDNDQCPVKQHDDENDVADAQCSGDGLNSPFKKMKTIGICYYVVQEI